MNDDELLRYSRQILLQDFDIHSQEKLKASSALIVGAGGLGCPAAMYLASAGIGCLYIVDDDDVELSNLQRQIAHHTGDVGKAKVDSLATSLESLNPCVDVRAVRERLSENTLKQYIQGVDIVLDCSDNFATRFMVNQVCNASKTPLVSGAAVRAEGQLVVLDFSKAPSPCYRCLYTDAGDGEYADCATNGVLAPVVGIIGSFQALEAIKVLTAYGQSLHGRLMVFDFKTADTRCLKLSSDPACPVCQG